MDIGSLQYLHVIRDLKLKAGDDMLLDIIDSTISIKKERR
jgi:hypothetical protein